MFPVVRTLEGERRRASPGAEDRNHGICEVIDNGLARGVGHRPTPRIGTEIAARVTVRTVGAASGIARRRGSEHQMTLILETSPLAASGIARRRGSELHRRWAAHRRWRGGVGHRPTPRIGTPNTSHKPPVFFARRRASPDAEDRNDVAHDVGGVIVGAASGIARRRGSELRHAAQRRRPAPRGVGHCPTPSIGTPSRPTAGPSLPAASGIARRRGSELSPINGTLGLDLAASGIARRRGSESTQWSRRT